ncbi:hypothetical protein [Roseomonas chloroacetimidivorans]|jgi:hypothetical protein|uniref:hypothetical protein n=1 Tax=Roseomonas chloroacetimidivorans TaxID=1766656 RepID=UPI003C741218
MVTPIAPPARPRALCPIHSAAILEGPAGVSLHLHGADGAITQVPLTLAALREIAALAGATLAESAGQDRLPGL